MLARLSSAILYIGLVSACKTRPENRVLRHRTWNISNGASFSLLAPKSISLEAIEILYQHLPELMERLQKFNLHLQGRIGLFLYTDGYRFARATGHASAALRAFSTPRQIHLLLVDEDEKSARKAILQERFTHEACHAALFELCPSKKMPPWWQEGVASVVAQQGERRLALVKLDLLLRRRNLKLEMNLLKQKIHTEEEAFIRYALSHHLLSKICEHVGLSHIEKIARALFKGEELEAAYQKHFKLSVQQLLEQLTIKS